MPGCPRSAARLPYTPGPLRIDHQSLPVVVWLKHDEGIPPNPLWDRHFDDPRFGEAGSSSEPRAG